MSTISDLYYDNLCLADRLYNKSSELYKSQMKLTDMVEDFIKTLNEEQKKAFLSIDESRTKITSELECDNFIIGFKLGIRMMHEVFQDDVPECATFPLR